MQEYVDTKDVYLTEYFKHPANKKQIKKAKSSKKESQKKQENVFFP